MSELVVCGIDDSAGGRQALTVGAVFAEMLDAGLLPVHVLPGPFPDGDDARQERERSTAGEMLKGVLGGDADAGDGRREALRVEFGRPSERLAAVALERGATMLVVGSRGRGALKRALLGSVAAELLAASPCPVLAVSPGAVGRPATRWTRRPRAASVLCGVDGSAGARVAADLASRLAARLGKRLVLAHAYRPDTSSRGHASILMHYPGLLWSERQTGLKLLEAAGSELTRPPAAELRLRLGDPARALRRLARRERADLIVVGSRGRGVLRSALFGSVSGALAASAPVPVLVVPDHSAQPSAPQVATTPESAT